MSLDYFVIFVAFIYLSCFQGILKKAIFGTQPIDGKQYLKNLIKDDKHTPWDRWIYDYTPARRVPHYGTRTMDHMPFKALSFDCECPPNDECKINYEIDDKALDFLKIRGILKKHHEHQLEKDIAIIKRSQDSAPIQHKNIKTAARETQESCCCPPKHPGSQHKTK